MRLGVRVGWGRGQMGVGSGPRPRAMAVDCLESALLLDEDMGAHAVSSVRPPEASSRWRSASFDVVVARQRRRAASARCRLVR